MQPLRIYTYTMIMHMHVVSLYKVVEVREGQNTHMFDKFPYEQAENQSFSLIYEQECICHIVMHIHIYSMIRTISGRFTHADKRYAHLTALDVICDSDKTYDTWMYAVSDCTTAICTHTNQL